jgi:hypothetical protein
VKLNNFNIFLLSHFLSKPKTMKTRFLLTLFLAAAAYIIFSSRTTGAGFNGVGDVTGSPVAGGTCGNCHSGGSFGASVTITLRDQSNNPVTSYVAGQSYILEFDVNNSSGTPGGFGGQAVALTSTNANAGTMGSTITSNTRIVTISGRSYLEQNSISASGLFRVNWTAPAAGTGNVRIFASGLAVNANGGTSGDQVATANIQISEQVPTTISFSQSSYCQNSNNPTPNISGTTGGSFTAGAGLSINASSGQIDLAGSTPGTYTVTYNYSGGSTTTSVTVTAQDAATLSYGVVANFCASQTSTVSPTITGVQSGSFSATPSGLNINSSTGVINPSASSAGNYVISYTTSGPCPRTVTSNLTILQADNANFGYAANSFCISAADASPSTAPATSGGTYSSSPAGLSLNSTNGLITLASSAVGSYSVTYITTGTCPDSASVSIQILASGNADFNYANASYCNTASDPTPNILGLGGGTFSSSNGLVINSSSGQIDLSASIPGNYTVLYNVGGSCPASDSTTVSILQSDVATISYATASASFNSSIQDTVYAFNCTNPIPAPLIFGIQGGTFTTNETGVNLNSTNGEISSPISNLNFGPSAFVYTTAGACPVTDTFWVSSSCATAIATISDEIRLYPNPSFDGNFNLEGNFDGAAEIEVYNLLGARVQSISMILNSSKNSIQINKELPKGEYLLLLKTMSANNTFRISIR